MPTPNPFAAAGLQARNSLPGFPGRLYWLWFDAQNTQHGNYSK
jgi:hypothetical protein